MSVSTPNEDAVANVAAPKSREDSTVKITINLNILIMQLLYNIR